MNAYAILDTEAFDDVVEPLSNIVDAPVGVVNFIADNRRRLKAEVGFGAD